MPLPWHCCSFHVLLLLLHLLLFLPNGSRGIVTCPQPCDCEEEEVRCENSLTLSEIPQLLPNNDTLRRLLVTRVNITTITNSSFPFLRHLTTLDLHNNQIETLADGAFHNLPQLHTLILRRNFLKHLANHTFAGLEGLKVLDLSWNCFMELHHRWFQHLTGLEVFDLARNEIELIQGEAFIGLANLQVLNLTRNKVMSVSNKYLAPLVSLQTLVMDDNSIHIIENNSFSSQSALTRLSLMGNRDLRVVQANAFVYHPKVLPLEELSLKGTHLIEVPVDMLKSLPALRTLDLSQTAIRIVKGRSFSTQGYLLNLTLDSMYELSTIEAHAFAGLTRLETLVISNNQALTNISWGAFRNLTSLRYLDLHNNALETLLSGQARWQDIEVVDLRGNPLRCDCHAGWILTLLRERSNESSSAQDTASGALPSNSTCSEDGAHDQQRDGSAEGTVAFTRQIRCHMPPDLFGKCLSSLTANQFRCPRVVPPSVIRRHNDRRLIVAVVAASLTVFFLITCGLILKFRRRLLSVCNRQYRYRAHWNHGVNGASPSADIVELETTQLEDFDSDLDTRP